MEEKIKEILESGIIDAEHKDAINRMLDIDNPIAVITCLEEIFNRICQEMCVYSKYYMTLIKNILESMNILITDYSSYLSEKELILIDRTLYTINYKLHGLFLRDDFLGFNDVVKKINFRLLGNGGLSSVGTLDEERASLSTNFKPLSLEDLQEGDYFGVCAYDLLPVVLYNDDATLNFIVPSTINYNETLKDRVLLFKYLGDNKCVEFYTGYEVELGISRDETYTYTEKDKCLFVKELNRIINFPLCIYKEDCRKKLYAFDDEFKERFVSQQGTTAENMIPLVIYQMTSNNRKIMAKRINRLVEADYEVAKKEYDFELSLAEFESRIAGKKELRKTIDEDKKENYSFEAGV